MAATRGRCVRFFQVLLNTDEGTLANDTRFPGIREAQNDRSMRSPNHSGPTIGAMWVAFCGVTNNFDTP